MKAVESATTVAEIAARAEIAAKDEFIKVADMAARTETAAQESNRRICGHEMNVDHAEREYIRESLENIRNIAKMAEAGQAAEEAARMRSADDAKVRLLTEIEKRKETFKHYRQ